MKFQTFGLAVLPCFALLMSCSDDTDNDSQQPSRMGTIELSVDALYSTHHTISPKEAEEEALEAAKRFFNNNERTVSATIALKSTNETSKVELPDTLAYIVNFSDYKGYALITADDRSLSRVCFCTEQGYYHADSIKANIEMVNMISKSLKKITYDIEDFEHYRQTAKAYCDNKNIKGNGNSAITSILTEDGPYISNLWGQFDEYNALCHKCSKCEELSVIGCAQLSVAQVMSYYKKPDKLPDGYTLHWDKILDKKRIYNLDSVGKKDLQHFLGFVQKANEKNIFSYGCYNHDGTSATVAKDFNLYRTAGYSIKSDIDIDNGETLFTTLQKIKSPIVIADEIHGWVVDGYKVVAKDISTLTIDPYGSITLSAHAEPRNYVHNNWGWEGDSNGYFELNLIHDPSVIRSSKGMPMLTKDTKCIYLIHPL